METACSMIGCRRVLLEGHVKTLEGITSVPRWRSISDAGDGPQIYNVELLRADPDEAGYAVELAIETEAQDAAAGLGFAPVVIWIVAAGAAFGGWFMLKDVVKETTRSTLEIVLAGGIAWLVHSQTRNPLLSAAVGAGVYFFPQLKRELAKAQA